MLSVRVCAYVEGEEKSNGDGGNMQGLFNDYRAIRRDLAPMSRLVLAVLALEGLELLAVGVADLGRHLAQIRQARTQRLISRRAYNSNRNKQCKMMSPSLCTTAFQLVSNNWNSVRPAR